MNRNNRNAIVFKITIAALLSAFVTIVNLIFYMIPGLDFTFLLIAIFCIVLKTEISFLISITTSFISFLYKNPIFDGISYLLTIMTIFGVFTALRKVFIKQRWLIFVSLILISTLYDTYILILWILATNYQQGLAIYLTKVIEIHVIFVLYTIAPLLMFKKIENILYKLSSKWEFIMNKNYIEYIENMEKNKMNKFSDNKKNYNFQVISLILSMNVMLCYFSFIPLAISTVYNYKLISIIIIIPILMLLMTPIWMKLKKKVSNKVVLTHNCTGLIIAITFTFLGFILTKYVLALTFLVLGLLLFGIFIAGFIPINLEMIKSYNIRNKRPNNINKILALTSFILIPVPFLIYNFSKPIYNLTFFIIVILVILSIMILNKNIMSEGNVLNVNKDDFKVALKNKKFITSIFTQNLFIGIDKFFEYGLIFLFLIYFDQNSISISLLQKNLYIYIMIGFLFKYMGRAVGYLIRIKDNYNIKINFLSSLLYVLSFTMILAFFITSNFKNFNNKDLLYKTLIIVSQFIIGFAYILIKRTQSSYYKKIINNEHINGAFILDHVIGNVLFSLLISIVFLMFFLLINVNIINFIIMFSILVSLTFIVLLTNIFILKNNTKLVQN
ncbi:hypothetical protein SCORR_v1c07360 [Spiroplasma corruscae]|uniref:MFS transporter n=1 Tax=Spiroplasma corruscae TaxID=216934 RepID=A0A222EPP8_9MOLU|nr:hypothetical protein [Spiroplasma corruscae]ASP28508.1 hypothetical protein SCORR_v1c07360 [Spiroplasma corruscae]